MRKAAKFLFQSFIAILLIVLAMCYMASAPYKTFEAVSEETVKAFDLSRFFSPSPDGERARVLFSNEEAMLRRIQLANNAKTSLDISTFELEISDSTLPLMASLMMAARRGVRVRLLVDGGYPFELQEILFLYAMNAEENLTIKLYNPRSLLHPERWMPRLHDKIFLADDTTYIMGGRNTTSYFLTGREGLRHDWDVMVESRESASAGTVRDYFNSVWDSDDSVSRFDKKPLQPFSGNKQGFLEDIWREGLEIHQEWQEMPDASLFEDVNAITLLTNPIKIGKKEPVLLYELSELMIEADGDIVTHTPYIILNDYMKERLEAIVKSGKSFKVMTNSPASNDNLICAADYMTNKNDILSTGISILEFNGGNSYHGKCFTLGERLSGIGSFNWDIRSAYLDTEFVLVIDSPALNWSLREYMRYYEEQAIPVRTDGTYDLRNGEEEPEMDNSKRRMLPALILFDRTFHYLL